MVTRPTHLSARSRPDTLVKYFDEGSRDDKKSFCVENHPLTKTLVLLALSENPVSIFFEFLTSWSPLLEYVRQSKTMADSPSRGPVNRPHEWGFEVSFSLQMSPRALFRVWRTLESSYCTKDRSHRRDDKTLSQAQIKPVASQGWFYFPRAGCIPGKCLTYI